jgi:hypothetical protein
MSIFFRLTTVTRSVALILRALLNIIQEEHDPEPVLSTSQHLKYNLMIHLLFSVQNVHFQRIVHTKKICIFTPSCPTYSQMNLIHILTSYFLKIQFIAPLSSTPNFKVDSSLRRLPVRMFYVALTPRSELYVPLTLRSLI